MAFLQIMDKFLNQKIIKSLIKNKIVNLLFLSILFFIVVFFTFYSSISFEKYDLNIGQKSPVDIRATRDIEDQDATRKLIEKAIEAVEPRHKVDPTIQIDIKKKIEKFFKQIYQERKAYNEGIYTYEEAINHLNEYNNFKLSNKDLDKLLKSNQSTIENIESYIYEVIIQVMSTGIKNEELDSEKEKIKNYFTGLEGFSQSIKTIAINVVNNSIRANSFLDKALTQEKRNEATEKVEKVYIKSGQVIVSEGEEITTRQYKILKELGLINDNEKEIIPYIGIVLIILLIEGSIFAYIYYFNRKLIDETSKLYLIIIIFLIVLLIAKPINSISIYLIPIAAFTMLVGILISPVVAIVMNIFLSILITLLTANSLSVFIGLLIGGTIAAISTSNTHQRANIFISGIIVSIANFIIISSFGLMYDLEMKKILVYGFYGGLNGLLCSILTIGSLPVWEYIFSILTPIKLLEMSNPNHPLLKRLLVEAPGTYHHSIIVGNLSESAAQAIDCNGLLARVGSYYHDIGKLTRPYFFKENQLTADNPHDKIIPNLSSNIIRNHVTDGIKLAEKHKLPKEIINIIEQHHGTTLVKYFYFKATNEANDKNEINELDYRYVGPKPQTKEAAIVMMADSVEAAVRSLSEPTKENIKNLVEKIIEDKLESEQLTNCELTFKDLEIIGKVFVSTLSGIFHERIQYPEINEKGLEVTN